MPQIRASCWVRLEGLGIKASVRLHCSYKLFGWPVTEKKQFPKHWGSAQAAEMHKGVRIVDVDV